VARQLATALENSRLFATVRQRAVNLTVLNYVTRRIVGALDAGEIIRLAVTELSERFVYALVAVLMLDDDGRHVRAHCLGGTQAGRLPTDFCLPAEGGVAGRVMRLGEVHVANQPAQESLFAGVTGLRLGSELCAPILRDGEALGLLAVAHGHPGGFSETDVLTLEALAGLLANALRSASLYADVQARMAELRQAQAQLVQSEKFAAIGRLTASIAHEVNNPLQSVHNCLRLAAEERLPAERRQEYLSMAEAELLRLMDIVRRMLEYYRPAGAERAAVSVNWLVEDVLALSGKQIRDAGIELRCEFAADVRPVTVVANHVRQVFLNLILNAVEAMPSGGHLRIATINSNGEVAVRFEDTGPGVPPEDVSKLFEPFYTTKARGTGLGLSVSYGIVAAHGGWIVVESQPGKGAAFTVHLPVEDT
jgi:signal transduction histidine kinase